MPRLKICYVFAALPVGGAERLLLSTLRELDRGRFDPLVCSLSEKGPIGHELEGHGIPVIALGRMRHRRFDPLIIRDLARLLRDRRIDIVHTHLYHGGLYGRLAAWRAGVPARLATFHNVYPVRRWRRHLVNRLLARLTDRVLAVSAAVRDDLIHHDGLNPGEVAVLENAIEVDAFQGDRGEGRRALGLPLDAFVIGTIGKLETQKGHRFLLEAFGAIRDQVPGARLVIVGAGKLDSSLRDLAGVFGLADAVQFPGLRSDIPRVLASLDVFALPSLWEGLPIVLLEAMAAGLPVVATRVGGIPDVLVDGETGFLVEPERPELLAGAILRCLTEPSRARRMADAAGEVVRSRFSIPAYTRRLEKIYEEVYAFRVGARA